MQHIWVVGILLVVLFGNVQPALAIDQAEDWSPVEKAIADGLPKTAVEKLDIILSAALAKKKFGEAARALTKKIVLEGTIQGNKAEEKIVRLEKEIPSFDVSLQPLLRVVLAHWYWQYYRQNNWRFLNRSTTQGLDEKDFTTWDLPKLFKKIGGIFEEVLKEETVLQKVPVESFSDFLIAGNQPIPLRPTLFDFIAHETLQFYMSGEQAAANPQDAFEIDAESPALGDAKAFLAWEPDTGNTDSPKFKAVQLFRRLMKYHSTPENREAFLDLDLMRLTWLRGVAIGESASENYLKRMLSIAKESAESPLSTLACGCAAAELVQQGKNVEAHKIAAEGLARFPNSDGARNCRAVIAQLERRELSVTVERIIGKPLPKLRVNYKNIDKVSFKLVSYDWRDLLKKKNWSPENLDWEVRQKLASRAGAEAWSSSLPPTPDFSPRTEEVVIPQAAAGLYYLVASCKPDFSQNDNCVAMTPVWFSSLALVSRARGGEIGGLVLDNESGEPIAEADVDAFTMDYDHGWRRVEKVKTDATGVYTFSKSGREASRGNSIFAIVHARGETLFDLDGMNSNAYPPPSPQDMVFFFTDRAIYRPGQSIQYKGLVVHVDPEGNRYDVLPSRSSTVYFRDVNGQEVAKQTVTSNAYGSFSGSFTAPGPGRLLGQMSLWAEHFNGNGNFRVEEYKRPKFKVTLEQPAEGGKLNERITVKGLALAFTGAAIDGAKIKYRVTREARLPDWCWWCPVRPAGAQEISHGVAVTDGNGGFSVTFTAKPDRSIPEKDQPTFIYRVSADVTDSAGETRSAEQSVRLGYAALELGLQADSWLDTAKPVKLRMHATTLDGKGIPAHGSLQIHALKSPATPVRPDLDQSNPGNLSDIRAWEVGDVAEKMEFDTAVDGSASASFTLKPGAYRAVSRSRDRFGTEVSAQTDLLITEPNAKQFATRIPFHFRPESSFVEVGNTFRALWGTGYSSGRAYIEIEHHRRILKAFWTEAGTTQQLVELPITEELRGGFHVRIVQVRENRAYPQDMYVDVPWSNKELGLSFAHFTSKMQPGQKDTWTVSVKGPGAEMKAVEMVAGMYDASLDAFAPHSWLTGFGFFRRDDSSIVQRFGNASRGLENIYYFSEPSVSGASRVYHRLPDELVQNFMGYEMERDGMNFADGPMGGSGGGSSKGMVMRSRAMPRMSMEKKDTADKMECAKSAPMDAAAPCEAPANEQSLSTGAGAATTAPGNAGTGADLSKVSARTNLNETAFFFPHLAVESDGSVKMTFTMPEALTTWKFLGFAHGLKGEAGGLTGETVTQKDLMVQPNPPRFLREGDVLTFTAKVTNLSETVQKGKIRLSLRDSVTDKPRDAEFGLSAPDLPFEVPAKESRSFGWTLTIPDGPGIVAYKVVAATDNLSDGEEAMLPILSRRLFVTESLPLPIRGPGTKSFKLQKLLDAAKSNTLVTQALTVQMTSNPAWYAVQALPYLMEFPHECSEQLFNRIYANSLARFIARSDPKIRKVFETWKADEAQGGKALLSNLEKNQDLKSVVLLETPWVCQAKTETENKHQIGVLFDDNRIESELSRGMEKLKQMQAGGGYWPWFPGGPPNSFITMYITTGFGRLRHLGVDVEISPALRALDYLDSWLNERYREILRYGHKEDNHLTSEIALYFYGRSFFLKEKPIAQVAKEAVDYFTGQAQKYWLQLDNRLSQGHLALGLSRFGEKTLPSKIFASIKERSVTEEEMGRFWRETELSWWWYRAPIETQAIMVELFDEIGKDADGVEECKIWLLKQKQTQDWKTTKATADAIYALLLKGDKLLASDKLVKVSLGGIEIQPEKVEAGTGFYEQKFPGSEVKPAMGDVVVTKEDKGIAWGGLHWQYLEDMTKITPHETNLKLKKTLFVKTDTPRGPEISPVKGKLSVGDLLVVRIELRTDRDMEYVHMKDGRGSGLEPIEALSGYRYQDGLGYYQSPRDTATHFYFDYLPKGVYVFEYNLRVQHKGRYQTGMAEIQCMYAPEFGSHSESFLLEVE
ncbi:MAG: alpha-2-macroglobulin family protein [Candidatus Ozemobacteraceae bacterium]